MAIKNRSLKILKYFVIIYIQKKGKNNMTVRDLINKLENFAEKYSDALPVEIEVINWKTGECGFFGITNVYETFNLLNNKPDAIILFNRIGGTL